MVGGLVEQQHVGLGGQRPRQRRSGQLSPGEASRAGARGRPGVNPRPRATALESRPPAVASGALELALGSVVAAHHRGASVSPAAIRSLQLCAAPPRAARPPPRRHPRTRPASVATPAAVAGRAARCASRPGPKCRPARARARRPPSAAAWSCRRRFGPPARFGRAAARSPRHPQHLSAPNESATEVMWRVISSRPVGEKRLAACPYHDRSMVGLFPTCLGDAVAPQRGARRGGGAARRRCRPVAPRGARLLRPAGLEQRLRRRRQAGRPHHAARAGRRSTPWWCRPARARR